jgi:hypothetical protein
MLAVDEFAGRNTSIDQPATNGFAITPHDTNELDYVTRAFYVGGGGDVKLTTSGGDTITLAGVAAGEIVPIRAKLVFSTGTTATDMIGLY